MAIHAVIADIVDMEWGGARRIANDADRSHAEHWRDDLQQARAQADDQAGFSRSVRTSSGFQVDIG